MNKMLLALAVACVGSASAAPEQFRVDKDTCCLIAPRKGAIADVSGNVDAAKIVVDGVEIVKDKDFGEVLRFSGGNGITVPDEGKIDFKDGITLEAWVYFEKALGNSVGFAHKYGKDWQRRSFETSLVKDNKFSIWLLGLEPEKIDFTQDELKHHWRLKPDGSYGGRGGCSNGNTPMPTGTWSHVAFTYDPVRRLNRIWVNGSIDREYFRQHALNPMICDEDDAPLRLFEKAKDIKVAQFRLSRRARVFGETPPVRVYIHENAYRHEGYVHIEPIRDDLPLPLEVEVMNIQVPFISRVNRYTMRSATRGFNVGIPKHDFVCIRSDLVVKLKKDGREFWRQESLIMNPSPVSAQMARFYGNKAPYAIPPKNDWSIEKDNTFSYKGKPFFPLKLYFARPQYFDLVADIGFNMIGMRRDKGMKPWEFAKVMEPFYAKAAARGITIECDGDVEGRPGQGFITLYDEPYGFTFESHRLGYMDARNGRVHAATLPIVATQNNDTRYRETSMCCDILAPDPYNIGRTPLRSVYDAIRAACEDVDHLKPVMCIIGNYAGDDKRPDAEELRTECYLAIAAGSTGLAFYSWDEGDEPGGPYDTSKKPEQIESYRKLFKEFKVLEPALTTANVGIPRVEPAEPRGFFPCVKKGRDGKIYLIVASDLYRSAMKRIVIPSAAGRKAKLLFGPGRVGKWKVKDEIEFLPGGKAEVALPPVSSAVYVFEK